ELPGDGLAEVAVGQFDQQTILPVEHVSMKGELVRVAGQAQKMGTLSDQVERDIRQAKVDFQRRGMATPFRETLAQDQRIVAQPLAIIDNGRVMMSLGWRVEGAM